MVQCPFYEICVTPQWYYPRMIRIENNIEINFVDEVCKTERYKECTHYMGLECDPELKPESEKWKRIRKAIRKHPLYKKKFNPSKREN